MSVGFCVTVGAKNILCSADQTFSDALIVKKGDGIQGNDNLITIRVESKSQCGVREDSILDHILLCEGSHQYRN